MRYLCDRVLLTGEGGVQSGALAFTLYRLIGMCRPKLNGRVLDVGGGDGKPPMRMAAVGFSHLTGVVFCLLH